MFPMKPYHRMTILIDEKESGITVNHRFRLHFGSFLQNTPECFINIIRHGKNSGSGICFCCRNVNIRTNPLNLMINVNQTLLHINIRYGESCKLRNTESRLEQDVDALIILTVMRIVFYKIEESLFLLTRNCFTSTHIVNQQ